jgi:hypothetical protein
VTAKRWIMFVMRVGGGVECDGRQSVTREAGRR